MVVVFCIGIFTHLTLKKSTNFCFALGRSFLDGMCRKVWIHLCVFTSTLWLSGAGEERRVCELREELKHWKRKKWEQAVIDRRREGSRTILWKTETKQTHQRGPQAIVCHNTETVEDNPTPSVPSSLISLLCWETKPKTVIKSRSSGNLGNLVAVSDILIYEMWLLKCQGPPSPINNICRTNPTALEITSTVEVNNQNKQLGSSSSKKLF